MTTFLTIQQAAAATGLTVHTLRYYERIGLIDPVARQANQHRLYSEDDIRWIDFLLKLRSTGLPVRQMQRYAQLRREGNHQHSVSERKILLEQHTIHLEAQLAELNNHLDVMYKKIAMYADMESAMHAATPVYSKEATHENTSIRN